MNNRNNNGFMAEILNYVRNKFFPSRNDDKANKNWVTIRLWHAKNSEGLPATPEKVVKMQVGGQITNTRKGGNVGHASVQTMNSYASIWPAFGVNGLKGIAPSAEQFREIIRNMSNEERIRAMEQINRSEELTASLHAGSSVAHDEMNEERKPDTKVTFYHLDNEAVDRKHEELRERSYRLSDKVNPKFQSEEGLNCSSMAYLLLEAGGINLFSPKCTALKSSIRPITPNQLVDCITEAKFEEMKRYPETAHFNVPDGDGIPHTFRSSNRS